MFLQFFAFLCLQLFLQLLLQLKFVRHRLTVSFVKVNSRLTTALVFVSHRTIEGMTSELELGIGILMGAAFTALIFLGINFWRSKQVFMSTESVKARKLAEQILTEINIPTLIIDEAINPVFANQPANEFDGQDGLYEHITNPDIQTKIINIMTSNQPRTLHTSDGLLRLHFFPLDHKHVILMAHDISEEGRLINMRRDFITNMSHELKTPIAAIGLLVSAISKAADNQELVERFSKKLEGESRRLLELSKDVIKLSEAQSPLTFDEKERIELNKLVVEEIEVLEEFATQNGVKVRFLYENPKRKPVIFGRSSAIRSAISNLITNAVTYSPVGGIVTVSLESDKEFHTLKVADAGPGIAKEHQSRIFERFFRADESRNRKSGGTGLGLSIVRNAARTHGGDVAVESNPGLGATFELKLPVVKSKDLRG